MMVLELKNTKILAAQAQCEEALSNLSSQRPPLLDKSTFYSMVSIARDGKVAVTPRSNTENEIRLAESVRKEILSVIEKDRSVSELMAETINQILQ